MHSGIRFCRSADGARIAYYTAGKGAPLVQTPTWLTHIGLDADGPWRPWIDELRRDHRLVRYDLRGCGLSDRDCATQSLASWVADLEAVVDRLELERFPLFGLCQGAAIAVGYAARHPDRVSRLVLYGSYLQGVFARPEPGEAAQQVTALGKLIETGWGGDRPAFREVFACLLMPSASPGKVREMAEMERHSASAEMAARLWTAFHRVDVRQAAPRVRAPTLVLHCRGDGMVAFEEGRRLAARIPDARFVALDSDNHILQADEPAWERLWEELHGFLGRPAPAAVAPYGELTPREREVLDQLARGRSNPEISSALGIRPKTVRNHVSSIFGKLGTHHRAEAVVRARQAGFGAD